MTTFVKTKYNWENFPIHHTYMVILVESKFGTERKQVSNPGFYLSLQNKHLQFSTNQKYVWHLQQLKLHPELVEYSYQSYKSQYLVQSNWKQSNVHTTGFPEIRKQSFRNFRGTVIHFFRPYDFCILSFSITKVFSQIYLFYYPILLWQ